ncbi:carbohydrate-binding protein [Balneola sp. MJW-20]|uniref:carbohydrate-binding protein n=1 Tax=Gracilimonas aurantiaca TaxID=3234185 RepID=UPI003465D4DF
MKTVVLNNIRFILLGSLLLVFVGLGCERSTSGLEEPEFPDNPDVFIDGFSSGLEYYPFEGSKLDAFSVDDDVIFGDRGASMRFDVPNVGDPDGSYAGAIFRDDNGGRNLTDFDALTFYAKGTTPGTINEIGFGQDFFENKFLVTLNDLKLTTNWKKYIIPIPDASQLRSEQGLFWYAEGPEDGDGYSFWVDELKFERLETIAQPRPSILGGIDASTAGFIGLTSSVTGLTQTLNLGSGEDVTLNVAPGYFTFNSSNPSVATVSENGEYSITGTGTTVITASLGGVDAEGSLTIESLGNYTPAPTPTEDPANVISVFSDAEGYENVPVDYYNGFFNGDGQTTEGGTGEGGADLVFDGDGVINYTSLNFVGIGTFLDVPSIDASSMTHLHVDINVREAINEGDFIRVQLINSVGNNETAGSFTIDSNTLRENEWASVDIPLYGLSGLTDRTQIGLLFFISDATISNIFVDNIYYYDDGSTPPTELPDIPITFDDPSVNYTFTVFNGTSFQVIDNPVLSGSNPAETKIGSIFNVGRTFEGAYVDLDTPLNLANGATITADVYSTKPIPVLLKFENGQNGAADIELSANHTGSGWEEITWSFSSADQYSRLVFFMDGPGTTSGIFYIDNIEQN